MWLKIGWLALKKTKQIKDVDKKKKGGGDYFVSSNQEEKSLQQCL